MNLIGISLGCHMDWLLLLRSQSSGKNNTDIVPGDVRDLGKEAKFCHVADQILLRREVSTEHGKSSRGRNETRVPKKPEYMESKHSSAWRQNCQNQ